MTDQEFQDLVSWAKDVHMEASGWSCDIEDDERLAQPSAADALGRIEEAARDLVQALHKWELYDLE